MGGKHPRTIITDQDMAMRPAIKEVFPETVHRNCFFHIKANATRKMEIALQEI
jgi:transposase-like protein